LTALYLALILCLGSLSVICTIIVINTYFRSDEEEPMPKSYRMLTMFLARLTCHKGYAWCFTFKPTKVNPEIELDVKIETTGTISSNTTKHKNETKRKKGKIGSTALMPEPVHAIEASPASPSPFAAEKETPPSWKELALLLDKFFFSFFIIVILTSSCALVGIIMGEWMSISN